MVTWMIIITIILFLALSAFGWYFSSKIILPRTHTRDFTYQHEIDQEKISPEALDSLPREEVKILSPFGYHLNGYYFPQANANYAVIISHGITWSLFGSVKYMRMFYDRGYSVLLYDHRNHGANTRLNTTFGFYEKHDLKTCVDWLVSHSTPGIRIGLMGESLGASISLQSAAIDDRIAFVVADCPYSDLQELLEFRVKSDFRLPARPLLLLAEAFVYLRAGFRFRDVSPIRDLSNCLIPIFFAHGENDTYIPPRMSVQMVEQMPATRRLYLAPHAGHAEAYWTNRMDYERHIGTFLSELVEKPVKAVITP